MDTFTLFYAERYTEIVRGMYEQLDNSGDPFHSLFDNDSTGGSYDQFTVLSSDNKNTYVLVHDAKRAGILTHYTVS